MTERASAGQCTQRTGPGADSTAVLAAPGVRARRHRRGRPWAIRSTVALIALLGLGACGPRASAPLLLAPEGNRLHALALPRADTDRILIPSAADAPGTGRDINGQICVERRSGRFVTGEDTGQPKPPPGFGVFELNSSNGSGEIGWRQIGKLTPTFQGEPGPEGVPDTADPYGCAFLPDGRLLTTDIGNGASGPGTGQLILWFPPLDAPDPRFCKLDIEIPTAQSVLVDAAGEIWVAAARSGVWRYDEPLPTTDDAAGGCGRIDPTGAPLADRIAKTLVVPPQAGLTAPTGLAPAPGGGLYVSSVINGVIAELSRDGQVRRLVLEPPAGEQLGPEPYSTGTPLGIAVDPLGTLYYADIAVVVSSSGVGPAPGRGSVRRIRFNDGEPQPPETLLEGLAFPDGVAVLARR